MVAKKPKGMGPAKDKLDLADANKLTDHLWIGGELDSADRAMALGQLDEIVDAGIDSIIDCRIESTDIDWVTEAKAHIDYLSAGVEDAGYVMPDDWWFDGTTYALDQISEGHVVFVHCQVGINRGPSMGFAILVAMGWDPIEALNLIRERRPIARVAYAEQAIDWWLQSVGAPDEAAVTQIRRIKQWRIENDIPRGAEMIDRGKSDPVD